MTAIPLPVFGGGPHLGVKSRRLPPSIPVTISNQPIEYLSDTLAGDGGAKAIDSGGNEVDFVSLDSVVSGDGTNWVVSGGRLLRNVSTPASSDGAVLRCTTTLGQIDVTIDAASPGYSFASDADIAAIVALGVVTVSGKTLKGRRGDYNWRGNNWFDSQLYTSQVTVTSHETGANRVMFLGRGPGGSFAATQINGATNLRLQNIRMRHEIDRGGLVGFTENAFLLTGAALDNIVIDQCEMFADLSSKGAGPGYKGIAVDASVGADFHLTITDNQIHDFRRCIVATGNYQTLIIEGNEVYNFGLDAIVIGNATSPGDRLAVNWNDVHSPINSSGQLRFENQVDYLSKASELTGSADDTKLLIFGLWRNSRSAATGQIMYWAQGDRVQLFRNTSGNYVCIVKDSAGVTIMTLTSASTFTYANQYGAIDAVLVSIDTDGTARMYIWEESAKTWALEASDATAPGTTIDLTTGDAFICSDSIGGSRPEFTEMIRLAVWQGQAPDISDAGERDNFVDPLDIDFRADPALSVTAYGTPIVDYYGSFSSTANKGNGGNLTLNGGGVEIGHGDGAQGIPNNDMYGFEFIGNYLNLVPDEATWGVGRLDRATQGGFFENIATFGNYLAQIYGNIVITTFTAWGIAPFNAQDSVLLNNTVVGVGEWMGNVALDSPPITIQVNGGSVVPSGNLMQDNTAYDLSGGGIGDNNLELIDATLGSGALSFPELFDGPDFDGADINTIAEAEAAFSLKAGGLLDVIPKIGAIGTGYFDRTNRTYDIPRINPVTYTAPADLVDQTVDTLVTSAITQITNVDRISDLAASVAGALVTISGPGVPQFQISSDAGGSSILVPWTDQPAILQEGQYLQRRVTSPPLGESTISIPINIGNATDTWQVTTETVADAEQAITDSDQALDNQAAYTFADKALGGANDRDVFVFVDFKNTSTSTAISTLTVLGKSATRVARAIESNQTHQMEVWKVALLAADATEGDIVVTPAATLANCGITVAVAKGYDTTTPVITRATTETSDVVALDINTAVDDLVLGGVSVGNNTTFTWAGLTEGSDFNGEVRTHSAAIAKATSAETPRSIDATGASITGNVRGVSLAYPEAVAAPPAFTGKGSVTSASNLTTYTFAAQDIKVADDVRHVVLAVSWENGSSARQVSTLTVDGVSASRMARALESQQLLQCELWIVPLTGANGATGDIVVTMSGGNANLTVGWGVIEDLGSTTPTAISRTTSHTGNVATLDLNTLDDSVVFAGMGDGAATTHTWAGATENSDDQVESMSSSSAGVDVGTGETPRALTCTAVAFGGVRGVAVCLQ